MTRVKQDRGSRGSLKWIQLAVAHHRNALDDLIRYQFPDITDIKWLSPLADDDFAEYRDAAFLDRLGLSEFAEDLPAFWPRRGPQWDALARCGETRLLIEAKAHLPEIFSGASQAKDRHSLELIRNSLARVSDALNAKPIIPWDRGFYQYANRIAHLYFLREVANVDARLVFVDFIGDSEMGGPAQAAAWEGAYTVVDHVLGLVRGHPLSRFIAHIHPDTRAISEP